MTFAKGGVTTVTFCDVCKQAKKTLRMVRKHVSQNKQWPSNQSLS